MAYVEVLANERADTAVGFMTRALAFYRRHGITVRVAIDDLRRVVALCHPRARSRQGKIRRA
jgi:hypothetical protein